MHCVARGQVMSTADHLMKLCGRFCVQRMKYTRSREDKEKGILIGICTNDIVWYWVRDKA